MYTPTMILLFIFTLQYSCLPSPTLRQKKAAAAAAAKRANAITTNSNNAASTDTSLVNPTSKSAAVSPLQPSTPQPQAQVPGQPIQSSVLKVQDMKKIQQQQQDLRRFDESGFPVLPTFTFDATASSSASLATATPPRSLPLSFLSASSLVSGQGVTHQEQQSDSSTVASSESPFSTSFSESTSTLPTTTSLELQQISPLDAFTLATSLPHSPLPSSEATFSVGSAPGSTSTSTASSSFANTSSLAASTSNILVPVVVVVVFAVIAGALALHYTKFSKHAHGMQRSDRESDDGGDVSSASGDGRLFKSSNDLTEEGKNGFCGWSMAIPAPPPLAFTHESRGDEAIVSFILSSRVSGTRSSLQDIFMQVSRQQEEGYREEWDMRSVASDSSTESSTYTASSSLSRIYKQSPGEQEQLDLDGGAKQGFQVFKQYLFAKLTNQPMPMDEQDVTIKGERDGGRLDSMDTIQDAYFTPAATMPATTGSGSVEACAIESGFDSDSDESFL